MVVWEIDRNESQSSLCVTKYDFDEKEQKRDTKWHDKGI